MAEEMRKFESTVTRIESHKHIPSRPNAVVNPGQASRTATTDIGNRKSPSKKTVLRLIEFFKK